MELVLVRLQISQLSELLAAIVKPARERFDLLVNDLVRPNIATLSKSFTANIAIVWSFPGVSSFMCL